MLDQTQKTFSKIKRYLLHQQEEVNKQLRAMEKDDPVSLAGQIAEAPESGTESWLAEVHGRLTTLKNDLLDLSSKIKKSLLRIKQGTYGKCENCGRPIKEERLKAMPAATLCLVCSKKSSG